jgi:hypothetical protein
MVQRAFVTRAVRVRFSPRALADAPALARHPAFAPTPHVIHTLHPICIPRIDMVIVKLQP